MKWPVLIAYFKRYIHSYVVPPGSVPLPLPRNQLAPDVQATLESADNEPAARSREIAEAMTEEANARQEEIETINSELRNTNTVLAGARTANSPIPLGASVGATSYIPLSAIANKDDIWMPGKTLVFDSSGTIAVYIGGAGGPSVGIDPIPVLTKSVPAANEDGVAKTVYFRDDIPFSTVANLDTPLELVSALRDGATYEIVISLMDGYLGAVSSGNWPVPIFDVGGQSFRLAPDNPSVVTMSAALNQIYTFRYQEHPNLVLSGQKNVGILSTMGRGLGNVVYTAQEGGHVDSGPVLQHLGMEPNLNLMRHNVTDGTVMRLLLGNQLPGGWPTILGGVLMVKVTERRSANPTN